MAKRPITAARRRKAEESRKAFRNIALALLALGLIGFFYVRALLDDHPLDPETLCPPVPASVTVVLVDVTDPMNLPQRQDFLNQLDRLIGAIPRYGQLAIYKVDPVSARLLTPIITRCNPGSASDVSEIDGNPQRVETMRRDQFEAPLRRSFDGLLAASGADRSPILESIQSVNLTALQKPALDGVIKRLVVASDLLQNTDAGSFYHGLPEPGVFVASQAFNRVRTDLRGVEVELWMLQRGDSNETQPRALPDLWERIIAEQGGRLNRVYNVSG